MSPNKDQSHVIGLWVQIKIIPLHAYGSEAIIQFGSHLSGQSGLLRVMAYNEITFELDRIKIDPWWEGNEIEELQSH